MLAKNKFNKLANVLILIISLSLLFVDTSYATGSLSLDVNITDDPSVAQTGQVLTYIIDYSCSGITAGCGDLQIDFPLDGDTELVEVVTSSGYSGTLNGSTLEITDNDGNFADGDAAQALVRVRVDYDLLGGETIGTTVTGSITTGPGGNPQTVTSTPPTLPVNTPAAQWSVQKTQTSPSGGVDPAPDNTATYEVALCSDSSVGNFSLPTSRLVDTFPAGAVVDDNPDGGMVTGNQIEWDLGSIDIETIQDGCVTRTYTLQYPAGTFPVGTAIDNSVEGFGTNPNFPTDGPCGINCLDDETVMNDTAPPEANPIVTKGGPGTAIISPMGNSTFSLGLNLSAANVPVENVVLTDTLPKAVSDPTLPAFDIISISSGTWDDAIPARVEYSIDDGTNWIVLGLVDGSSNTTWQRGVAFTTGTGNYITNIRWVFDPAGAPPILPAGFTFDNQPIIRFEPNPDLDLMADYGGGGVGNFQDYENCLVTDFSVDGGALQTTPQTCANARLANDPNDYANINVNKSGTPNEIDVEEDIQFTITVELTQEASGNLVDPFIEDILPESLAFTSFDGVMWTNVDAGDQVAPVTSTTNNGTNDVFTISFPGLNLAPPDAGVKRIEIQFTATAVIDAVAGAYDNSFTIVSDSPNQVCQSGTTGTDSGDIDGDSNTTEVACVTTGGFNVKEAAEMRSAKWVRSLGTNTDFVDPNNPTLVPNNACPLFPLNGNFYTRFPCIAQGVQGEAFENLMTMTNTGRVNIDNYIMYDVLPHIGDTGVAQATSGDARETEFISRLTGGITLDGANSNLTGGATFTVEYSFDRNSCRNEMSNTADENGWQPGCTPANANAGWIDAATVGGNWADVQAFRIRQTGGVIPPGNNMVFVAPMQIIPYDEDGDDVITEDDAETGEISWNSFAQRFNNEPAGTRLLTAEPRKVGIIVIQEYSIGNMVWEDNGAGGGTANDGFINGTEPRLPDITMQLFRDANGNNNFNAGADTLINTTVTDANGYYLFESDSGGNALTDGTYFVRIDPAEFGTGGDLVDYVGSTPQFNNNADNNDNGRNPGNVDDYPTQGIVNRRVILERDGTPTGEGDLSGNPADGDASRGTRFQEDSDSDLTIDFGVYKPHSIGNRVWLDDGAGGGTSNNGLIDGGEVGIDGVTVNLYRDTDNDGTVEPNGDDGGPVATDTTANGGYYLFDLLRPDQYIVQIDPSSFDFGTTPATDGPLARYISSTNNAGDTETDNDDNGIDPATEGVQRAEGVFSPQIDLEYDGENAAEAAADKDGTLTEPDGRRTDADSSELTVDFGFYEETTLFSLGNRVWLDVNNNRTLDAGEMGIDGVTLTLYEDDNSDGIPDDNGAPGLADDVVDTDTTTGGGYYLFDMLDPGRYVVVMDATNWTAGATPPLVDLLSSTGITATENVDNNDNGVDQANYAAQLTNGVTSNTVQLVPQGEPVDDDETGSGLGAAADNNSDLTVDFGLYKPMSLGNFVWRDSANTNGAIPGDGIYQQAEGEMGIDGVLVELYRDDGDGVFEPGTAAGEDGDPIATDTTANGGYYLFDDLLPGEYFVHIPFENFDGNTDPLFNHSGSDGTDGDNTDDIADNDDNGEPETDPASNGVTSEVITLTLDGETDTEAAANKEAGVGDGAIVTENNSDLTKDFGFYVPPLSLGNRVWFDTDGDGILEPGDGEVGIDDVTMLLYRDGDGDGVAEPDGDDGASIGSNVTHDGGYYIFDNLPPGDYFVVVDPNEFDTGGDLEGYVSTLTTTTLNDTTNYDDNGIDPTTVAAYTSEGVRSNVINLSLNAEPETSDEPADDLNDGDPANDEGISGRGSNGEEDNDSNLTLDFGFYQTVAIGNRVWLDEGAGNNNNNGQIDTDEDGIDVVTLNLYADTDRDGIVEPLGDDSTPFRMTTTDADGFYIFDNLPEGNYIVGIPADNFDMMGDPLFGLVSSSGADTADNEDDGDDNGVDAVAPATSGIFGPQINVTAGGQTPAADPANNDALGTEGDGRFGEGDEDSDLTMDFGFTREPMSLGNRVWYDADADGMRDPGETTLDNITVQLFRDVDNDGMFEPGGDDGTVLQTDVTHDGGYYIFDNLLPGNYFVRIDPTEFAAGNDLANHIGTVKDAMGAASDDNSNGNNPANVADLQSIGFVSDQINLTLGAEPTGEEANAGGSGDEGATGRGLNDEAELNSDLTIDFGVYQPVAIGNRVWLDEGANNANDNGVIDVGEVGINGVTVNLYADTDGDGTVEPLGDDSTPFRTTVTATNGTDDGFYLFDGLPPGEYLVGIPADNFDMIGDPLFSLVSSIGADTADNEDDGDDNGIDSATPATDGIFGPQVTLTFGGEATTADPANNDGIGTEGDGTNGERDEDSNLTMDFGFSREPMSLGNRVWYDVDGDGTLNGTETGIDNVTVFLYRDVNDDGVFQPNAADGTPLQTDVTHDGGYYIFDNLLPGNYFVQIDPNEFGTGGDLATYISTTTGVINAPIDDSNDNGVDPVAIANYPIDGVVSEQINLMIGTEPTGEDANANGSGDEGTTGRGVNNEAETNSDLTIDFGFIIPLSIGNRVWNDNGGTVGSGGIRDNGIQDGDEAGIANITVNLYVDRDGDGTVEPNGDDGAPLDSTTTDANGYYIFDGLVEGEYIVEVAPSNFAPTNPLEGVFSSDTGNTEADDGVDQNDKGIDEPNPSTNGVRSPQMTLTVNAEPAPANPTDDTDLGTEGNGTNNEQDQNSDLTVDFGFVVPPMSIGNRVWFDINNNGEIDTGEGFVNNARMDLFADTNGNGLPDAGEFVDTVNTDPNGYYLFDNLSPGAYIVVVNEQNFRTGGVLFDYFSTTDTPTPTDNDTDTTPGTIAGINTDDGIDSLTPAVGGIRSAVIQLTAEQEIDTETDKGPGGDGTNGEEITNSNLTVDYGFYKPMSIGNRVWFDTDNDGLIGTGENGAANVMVSLFVDENNDGIPDDIGAPGAADDVITEMTDANGYYLFDNLTPGNYRVRIDGANFDVGGVLQNTSSTTTNVTSPPAQDNNDNGIDQPDEAARIANGILSEVIPLTLDGQPTGENDFSNNPTNDGANSIGTNGERNNNSDISVDFGFNTPGQMSLGNRVWNDLNRDGLIDAGEDGIPNVNLSLYRDANGDGQPDNSTPIATTTTDGTGHYLFDGLIPGRYVVGVDLDNANTGNPLNGFSSTTTGTDNTTPPEDTYPAADDDNNDNGEDTPNSFGILSSTVDLTLNSERTDESDLGAGGDGAGITPANSDLTIDFGFYKPLSIGNRVWFDSDDNGNLDGTESGAANVFVTLFDDANNNGIADPGEEVATEQTDNNGYYLFDDLQPGNYIVRVDPINFTPGGPLEGTASSTPTDTGDTNDSDDNGVNAPDPATTGVSSGVIPLTLDSEPAGETDLSNNPNDGPQSRGNNRETDESSNLTVDFGFFSADTYSIGNRVWLDDDANGLIDGAESGIANVSVSLYRDANGDGQPDSTTPVATELTDANGYYLFDGLTQGQYVVGIDASNFESSGGLEGFASTLTNVDDNPADGTPPERVDSNDNRTTPTRTETFDSTFGILSNTVSLSPGAAPTGEADLSGNTANDGAGSIGNNGETDGNSDITIDFGFFPSMALGNRVWADADNNGLIDTNENGIGGVTVNLYRDDNTDGIPDDLDNNGTFGDAGDVIDSDVTDGNGYYLFSGVAPGSYVVGVDGSNFNPGNPLNQSASSTGNNNQPIDSNDNGLDTPDANGNILSDTVTLVPTAAPTNDPDTSGTIADGPNSRGTNNETDNNSDLTIDFGFVSNPMSIGNRVWLDNGAGGGTADNGVIDGAEEGIAGVEVELFADTDGDGQPDNEFNPIATDTTDSNGYYLFDGVPPGRYVVRIAPSNFRTGGALVGLSSSDGTGTIDTSSQDQGIDSATPQSDGILSSTILLEQNNEPTVTDEDDLSGNPDDGANSRGNNGETDADSNLAVDFGFTAVFDWGDAPDDGTDGDYGTTAANGGPSHQIVPQLFLGGGVDDEPDAQPNASADGDDDNGLSTDDEDGVRIEDFVAGTTVDVEVTVFNNTGSDATVVAWFDWDGDGTFDSGEAVTVTVPSSSNVQVIQLPVTVPPNADTDTGGTSYARIRLTTDTIDGNNPTGSASDGEVEDYPIVINPPGLAITKTDGAASIVRGQETTYTITITNSGNEVISRRFVDNVPTDDPNGFEPSSIEWTCTATNGASCRTGEPAGTGDTGTGDIDTFIDVPNGGEIVFTITATLRDAYQGGTVANTASLVPGSSSTDSNGVIFDPPSGTKIGVVSDGNRIRWTQEWINDGGAEQTATIRDTIAANQTYAGNLDCPTLGASTTTRCEFVNGEVIWQGTIFPGAANAIQISFDVIVPGAGDYENTAELEIVGGAGSNIPRVTASNTVTINPDGSSSSSDDDDDDDNGGAISTLPPATPEDLTVTIVGSPPFGTPGDDVTWTITITNNGDTPVGQIDLTSAIPPELTTTDVTSSSGLVTINGGIITFIQDGLPPGGSVTITILTTIRDDITNVNLITVQVAINGRIITEGQIALIIELPATGETPARQGWIVWVVLVLSVVSTGTGIIYWHSKRWFTW